MKRDYLRDIFRSDDLKWIFSIILMASVWIGIASDFYQLIPNNIIGWMNRIYRLFDNNIWLNIPTCLFILYHFYKFSSKIVLWEVIRYYCFFVIAFVYLILYYQSPFDYAIIVWKIDYRLFLSVLLGGVLLIMQYVFFDVFRRSIWVDEVSIKRKYQYGNVNGFSSDYRNERINLSLPIEAYVKVIVQKLKKTDLGRDNDSFAIGITSEWGTGKTTFLRRLKKEIRSIISHDIVDFNPWMCQSAEQVTRDFFSTLRNSLSQRHPELSSPIKKYAKLLRSITVPVFGNISFRLSPYISDKSLLEMKNDLSKKFSKLEEPVVVVIDDLDRLDSSEVFEVLRLIRNTADLSNMIYLVAYDKNYITKILENQHISDPVAYLEKIFQLEIQLPLVSDDSVWLTLLESLRQQLPIDTDISFIEDQKDLIKEILNSYRRAKRFARLFSLDFDYLNSESLNKLNLKEKFLLDLLQMDDKEIYDILWDQPEKLLKNDDKIWTYRQIEDGKDGVHLEGDTIILEDGTKIKPTTNKLLACLWPVGDVEIKSNSIRYVEYLAEYFTMKVQFTKKHVKQLIEANSEDVDVLIKQWSKNLPYGICDVIIDYNENTNLEEQQKKNLIWSALSACYYGYYSIKFELSRTIRELAIKENDKIVDNWFRKKLEGKECDYSTLMIIVQRLENDKVINPDNVKNIIKSCMQHFVNNSNCSILDCIQKINGIALILYWGFGHLNDNNRKIAFNYLIDFYSQKEQKSTMEEYEKVRDYILKKGNNYFEDLFKDNWKEYLVMVLQQCIEPKNIGDRSASHSGSRILLHPLDPDDDVTELKRR